MSIFEERESAVRSYCRKWPVLFDGATGSWLFDDNGHPYLDFFTGAGALNYGHNNPVLKEALLDYLAADRIIHSLDMFTVAKAEFLTAFDQLVLRPRGLDYKVQFPGPAGTIAVEAALKLARKVTGRTQVAYFTHGFHGMTLAALSVTGNAFHRRGAGVPLTYATPLPYERFAGRDVPDFAWLDGVLDDAGSGFDPPAAVIVECVQGEGGINVASPAWLRGLAERCQRHGILLIVDDVQMGCGRTGPFFSFEVAGIQPDIVCVSKSISGYGFPLALTLIRPELDIWEPGEHTGTFRGIDPALVTGTAALRAYWRDGELAGRSVANGGRIHEALTALADSVPDARARGRGMAHGLEFDQPGLAAKVAADAFDRGLVMETAGPADQVVKLMPSLTITDAELDQGLALLAEAVHNVAKDPATTATPALSQIPPQMPAPTISPTFSNPSLTLPGNSSTLPKLTVRLVSVGKSAMTRNA
jgi:diaminobutyrate-2-oxoglutarate transaminase